MSYDTSQINSLYPKLIRIRRISASGDFYLINSAAKYPGEYAVHVDNGLLYVGRTLLDHESHKPRFIGAVNPSWDIEVVVSLATVEIIITPYTHEEIEQYRKSLYEGK